MYDGRAIANFVLDRCEVAGRTPTNLSLQKILYFCHVWSLVWRREPLVKHQFEAWKFGPVLQYVYREFKSYDDKPITSRATRLDPVTGEKLVVPYEFDADTEILLDRVVSFYSRLSASDLVGLSHARGGPWDRVWSHDGAVHPGMQIDNTHIAEYYSRISPPFVIQ